MVPDATPWSSIQRPIGLNFMSPLALESGAVRKKVQATSLLASTAAFAWCSLVCSSDVQKRTALRPVLADAIDNFQRTSNRPGGTMVDSTLDWLDPDAHYQDFGQASRALRTEFASFGTVQLVDAGESLDDLGSFLEEQAQISTRQHEKCLLVATLPDCPSCAALGYALARASPARLLGETRLIRVNIEEFDQDLRQLGLPVEQVPAFALLDEHGKIVDTLDVVEWRSNDPVDFLPLLSNFIQRRLRRPVGGPVRRATPHAIEL
jgi:hypothetical protein